MSQGTHPSPNFPSIYPRLAYRDERAAIAWLERVFQLEEVPGTRTLLGPDPGGHVLAWLRLGSGIVMVGGESADVHRIMSPAGGQASVEMMVRVHDVDAHYAHAVRTGADITMPLEDAFFGERRYEASDLEGHRWCFMESFEAIRARGGRAPAVG